MRPQIISLNVPATQTQGTATPIGHLVDKWLQFEVVAAGGVSIRPQGRIRSGGAWVNLGTAAVTADGIVELPEGISEIRLDRVVAGTGTPIVTLFGRSPLGPVDVP